MTLKEKKIQDNKIKQQKFFDIKLNKYFNSKLKLLSLEYVFKNDNFNILLSNKCSIIFFGRIVYIRKIGSVTFLKINNLLKDIQVISMNKKTYQYEKFINKLHAGDQIVGFGYACLSKTKEKSLFLERLLFVKKTLLSFPKIDYNFSDKIHKQNDFYDLNIFFNKKLKSNVIFRNRIIAHIRKFFFENNFVEVTTPVLNNFYSGHLARPFQLKHLNKYSKFLRIAPELLLKRLSVSGFYKIFEIGKCFRNEKRSKIHNCEFNILEFYHQYIDLDVILKFLHQMFCMIAYNIFNKTKFIFNNKQLDLKKKYRKIKIFSYLKKKFKFDFLKHNRIECLNFIKTNFKKKIANNLDFKNKLFDKKLDNLQLGYLLFEEFSDELDGIVIIDDIPLSESILSKNKNKKFAKRYEILFNGIEIVNMYEELNDAITQQDNLKNVPNHSKNFIKSLKLGLTKTVGVGVGLDRLIMLLTESKDIREVVLFSSKY